MLAANSYASNLYVPSLSTAKGVVKEGTIFNTGNNSAANPSPILIKVTDFSQLSDTFRSNIKSCLVSGSGWGNTASGRVEIRLNDISCINEAGTPATAQVVGYLADTDNMAGIKTEVISKGNKSTMTILPGRKVNVIFTRKFTLKTTDTPKFFISGQKDEQNK